MANNYSADIPKGLNVPKQVRLDSITNVESEDALKYLGEANNLAFKYYEGLKVYCKDEKTEYVWRQVIGVETGLLTTHFVYPTYGAVDGIDYSGKSFNFFEVIDDGSETKINQGTNVTITGNGTKATPYVVNSNYINTTYSAGTSMSLTGTTFNNTAPDRVVVLTEGLGIDVVGTYPNFTIGIDNLQKVITYPSDFTTGNYTLTNADNNYEIIVDNGSAAVTITVPSGLTPKIGVGFTQKGTGNVTYVPSSTTINNPVGLKIKGQYFQTYLSQEGNTNNYFLGGNTKV